MPQTPGVYVEEINQLPKAIAQVDLSIPVFIGYTQKAGRRGKSLLRKTIKVESLKQFNSWFGEAFQPAFTIHAAQPGDSTAFVLNNKKVSLQFCPNNQLYLYQAVQLFFQNGGSSCFILSVGIYANQNSLTITADDFTGGKRRASIFKILDKEPETSTLILPDVIADSHVAYPLYQSVLEYCDQTNRHFAILDVQEAAAQSLVPTITAFREAIGNSNLKNAAAYYPWLHTQLVHASELAFTALDPSVSLEEILSNAPPSIKDILKQIGPGISKTKKKNIHLALLAGSADYAALMQAIQYKRNIVPPAGAVAAAYNQTDQLRGIWKAPANIKLLGVAAPGIDFSDRLQEEILSDVASGKYLNAIRKFTNKGILIWGARTLAGNNQEWRYVPVRRTIMMMEMSIGSGLQNFVFQPNNALTWFTIKSQVESFLYILWKQGALQGTKPKEAYHVQIGEGNTMTATDLMEGRLRMQVLVALLRPSEFMVMSFEQMQPV